MRASRSFSIAILIFQLSSIIAFGLSIHTIIDVSMNMASRENLLIEVIMDENLGIAKIRTEATARNDGLLGINIRVDLDVRDEHNNILASDKQFIHLDPGEERHLALSISAPVSEIQRLMSLNSKVFLNLDMGLRTLYDLVGVSNSMRVPLERSD
jgi:hypothetical protein